MNENQKNAIVVSLNDDVSEIVQLADSLEYRVVKTFIQRRKSPDVNSYIGSGKVKEIKEFIDNNDEDVSLIIVDSELKPSQWFFLEKNLNVDVFDRVRLILAIFEERAYLNLIIINDLFTRVKALHNIFLLRVCFKEMEESVCFLS